MKRFKMLKDDPTVKPLNWISDPGEVDLIKLHSDLFSHYVSDKISSEDVITELYLSGSTFMLVKGYSLVNVISESFIQVRDYRTRTYGNIPMTNVSDRKKLNRQYVSYLILLNDAFRKTML